MKGWVDLGATQWFWARDPYYSYQYISFKFQFFHFIDEWGNVLNISSFCAAAFKNESIHSDNLLVHELDPL